MKSRSGFILLMVLLPFLALCQQKDTLVKKLDSASKVQTDTSKNGHNNVKQENYNEVTKMTLPVYFALLESDVKQQFSAPFHIKTKDYPKIAAFTAITGALMWSDESINKFAVSLRDSSQAVVGVSKYVTRFGGLYEAYTLIALASYGFLFKNEKIKTTTFLATQAYLSSAIIFESMKFLSGRQRPNYYDPKTLENDPRFHGPIYQFKKTSEGHKPPVNSYTSFPSGHTCVAFAAATVFAMEYHDRPLVPIISYSAASLIGLSRLTENKHWASDVFVGAALGYLCGKQVVNNYHRYNKMQKEKHSLTFNMNYFNGKLLPGLVYKL
jgi:membrane-associated phospholipid phosphatase